jgi:MFS family permease
LNDSASPPAPARATRIGPIEFVARMSPMHAWVYIYQSLAAVALFSFLSFSQPYVLSEVLKIPDDQAGRLTSGLITMQEIVSLFLVGYACARSDRFGRRALFALGFLIMGIGYASFPFADSSLDFSH